MSEMDNAQMNIWQFNTLLSKRLLSWNVANFALGILLMLTRSPFRRGLGAQFAGWAVVNLLIAVFGERGTQARAARPDALSPLVREGQARFLRRLLWINAGLDVLYIIGGLLMGRSSKAGRRGTGLGIAVQGALLLIFDVIHARIVPNK